MWPPPEPPTSLCQWRCWRESRQWLATAQSALEAVSTDGVEIREPLLIDIDAIARRGPPAMAPMPRESEEEEFMPPLVARPRVIPLRSSTPVTALQAPYAANAYGGHGDGMVWRGAAWRTKPLRYGSTVGHVHRYPVWPEHWIAV